jgi:DNA-binding NarL/FixJ family response regulator
MNIAKKLILISADSGLIAHWSAVFGKRNIKIFNRFDDLLHLPPDVPYMAWVDLAMADAPAWIDSKWRLVMQHANVKIIAASSNPQDDAAIEALDAGCSGYCHAYSDPQTLLQIKQVVQIGHVWIGTGLMQRLIHSASRVATDITLGDAPWSETLTTREREVAILAANGASNQLISVDCKISERTVKAHLSAIFVKLNISDRLQLALRVHGIN